VACSRKGEKEEDRRVLLMLGRDDLNLLLAYLNSFAVPSNHDVSIGGNDESLPVRA